MMRSRFSLVLVLLALPLAAPAAEPFRYEEGIRGQGQLRYVNGLPILTVAGTPEEIGEQIGEQIGVLTAAPLRRLYQVPRDMLDRLHLGFTLPQFIKLGGTMLPQFPLDYRKELEALSKSARIDLDLLIFGNTAPDIFKSAGCSSVIVESERSATGAPLFGRNLDYPTLGILHEYSLVTVYHPKGKHAFVSIGFPGLVGCMSGMNDVGLALATHEAYTSKDGAPRLNPKGIPYLLTYRRILEECTTVAEAEKLLRSLARISH